MEYHAISPDFLPIEEIELIIKQNKKLRLSPEAEQRIVQCRTYLDEKLKADTRPVYGINTGFGSLYHIKIEEDQLEQLQKNLVMSHACGLGEEVPQEIVRMMLFLKIQSLAYGHSAVQLQTVQRLIDFYNEGIYPVIYSQGSLGASGDLAPLAHLSLPLIGEGEVRYQHQKIHSSEILKRFNWEPIHLKSKEGLALLNGTQFMSAYATFCIIHAKKISVLADIVSTISLEAFDGRPEPFLDLIHQVRPHPGQVKTAAFIRDLLAGSELIVREKAHVQDPYSFRCVPQVHGASKDSIAYCEYVFLTEINSVTDNPNIFPEEDKIISGGNFHGQPLALAMDFLAIALAELGNISERRTYQLISGSRGLPPFLVAKPGLNSGMMIPQYTAASLVSQNKQLCSPASIDSIVSSNGQEDHVSMGANAATKLLLVLNNVEKILGIELLNATQALDFRRPLKSSAWLEKIHSDFRKKIPFIENDRILHDDMLMAIDFVRSFELTLSL